MQINRSQAVVILTLSVAVPLISGLVGLGLTVAGVESVMAAIILWGFAGFYVLVLVVLMFTSNTARSFVLGSVKGILRRHDSLVKLAIPELDSSGETARARDRGIVGGLDKALKRLETLYHEIGDEAISYPFADYERVYLANREEWSDIKKLNNSQSEAVWMGLRLCFKHSPQLRLKAAHLNETLTDVPINPLLIEAESSNTEVRRLKAELSDYFVRFKDRELLELIEGFMVALQLRETSRIMYQLTLRFPMQSRYAEHVLELWRNADRALTVLRAVIEKRMGEITKPWWIRWIYA